MELNTEKSGQGASDIDYPLAENASVQESLQQTEETNNQDQWAAAMLQDGASQHSGGAAFGEPRYLVMERLVAAGVPHAQFISVSLHEFLADPESAVQAIAAEKYHLFVEPAANEYGARLRFKDRSAANILHIAAAMQEQPPESLSRVTLLEAPELLFHGNILVYSAEQAHGASSLASRVSAEFNTGDNPPVSRGTTLPEYSFRQDPYTESFRYDFDSPQVRSELYAAIKILPRTENDSTYDGFRPAYVPGYYEIGIARNSTGGGTRAYVYDMKPWK